MTAKHGRALIEFSQIVRLRYQDYCTRNRATREEVILWGKDFDNLEPIELIDLFLLYSGKDR